MTASIASIYVPIIRHHLNVLSSLLAKAELHVAQTELDPTAILVDRLYPDMHPLVAQVQFACDFAKGAVARLANVANPSYADDETTFTELQVRIAKTLAFIGTTAPSQLDGAEDRPVSLKFSGLDLTANGRDYLVGFAMPSFIFHVSIAYGILRHNGVDIGKLDFLGPVPGMTGLPVQSAANCGRAP